eukprot:scaffold344_cov235-Pinguiococcus_pyrenoidosus.AAC.3
MLSTARFSARRAVLSTSRSFTPAVLPDLQYDYGALEPVISGQIMELHHSKHHNTYVNGINAAMEKLEAAEKAGDISTAIQLQGAIKVRPAGSCACADLSLQNSGGIFWRKRSLGFVHRAWERRPFA